MADRRSDALTKGRLLSRTTRRAAARSFAALGVLPALAAVPNLATAKKGKNAKRGKRCKKREKDDQQATCPDACSDTCVVCAERVDGAPICGAGFAVFGDLSNACDSDSDCVGRTDPQGNPLPYCTTGIASNGGTFEAWPIGGLCGRMLSPCA